MSRAERYVTRRLDDGDLTVADIAAITRVAQDALGVTVDGMPGPETLGALREQREPEPISDDLPGLAVGGDGWLCGEGVERIPSDPSWYYDELSTEDGRPDSITAHYTDTPHGSGEAMARRRAEPRSDDDRAASWHVSVEVDGTIIQQAPLTVGCWHCRPTPEAREILGGEPNRVSVGIELVGHGDRFPAPQVAAAARVWRAIVRAYGIPRERAMVQHSELDPGRRRDPGELFMRTVAPAIMAHAFPSVGG